MSQYPMTARGANLLREELNEHDSPALHLKWTPGRINQHWKGNCLAVGLSQGFLEPLEAPMLNLVQQTSEAFIECCEKAGEVEHNRAYFNAMINRLSDRTRDYLQAHYALNSRNDSQYWIDNRNNNERSTTLRNIIAGWYSPGSFDASLAKHSDDLVYAKTSWYCLLAGMGCFDEAHRGKLRLAEKKLIRAQQQCQQLANRFVDQSAGLTLNLEQI